MGTNHRSSDYITGIGNGQLFHASPVSVCTLHHDVEAMFLQRTSYDMIENSMFSSNQCSSCTLMSGNAASHGNTRHAECAWLHSVDDLCTNRLADKCCI